MRPGIAASLFALITLCLMACANGSPLINPSNEVIETDMDPELMLQILARLGQSMLRNQELESSKRGLDFGMSRGFSGSQTAKHLLGLAAASYAGGPGRRKRDAAPFTN
ncbi:diuretic hormone class 2 isoform X2 [Cloeon dipterum]|uniref:diuretic hormone class 2 isoform X2 n=1 Tax=Cloeon dipterum TaxID=197152 RepID=UPI0032204278